METTVKNPVKNDVKTVKGQVNNAKAVNKSKKPKTKKAKVDIYSTEYGKEVLTVSKELKTFEKTFEGAIFRLQSLVKNSKVRITGKQKQIINEACKLGKNKTYINLKHIINQDNRVKKFNTVSPFYILQAIRKNVKELA